MKKALFSWVGSAALLFSVAFGMFYLFGGDTGSEDSAPPVFYVDPARPESGAGVCWDTAFNDLQKALDVVPPGSEIRCAAGDYGAVRMEKAVSLYGGFAGWEESREQRDWTLHRSVLTGVSSSAATLIDGFVLSLDTAAEGAAFFNGAAAELLNSRVEGSTTGLELLYFDGVARVRLINTYVCSNRAGLTASSGLVVFYGCGDVLILNSTIADNQLGDPGRPALEFRSSRGRIINTILWNPELGEVFADWLSEVKVSYSLIRGGYWGEGNIDGDPGFDSDYRLRADSPCRDAGLTEVAPERDWKGAARPFGEAADIGADECVLPWPKEKEKEEREEDLLWEAPLIRLLGEPTPAAPPPPPASSATPSAAPSPTPLPDCIAAEGYPEGFDEFVADEWTVPSGWEFFSIGPGDIYTSPGNYGASVPSLKFASTGARAVSREFSGAETLSFWVKGQNTDTTSVLTVEQYFALDWNPLTEIVPIPTSGTTIGPLAVEVAAVRLRFTYSKSVGNLAFDDVGVCLPPPPTPVPTASPSVTPPPPPSPSPSATPTLTPSPTPTAVPTASTTPTAVPTPSVIPWDGGLLLNPGFEFWDAEGDEADHWSWDSPAGQWSRTTDAYYEDYAGRLSRSAATVGNLDQFGKTMSEEVIYYAALMVKGSGDIRIGIRYPHTALSNFGDWATLTDSDWVLLQHHAAPNDSGEDGGLRIQVRNCVAPFLAIDNAYLGDVPAYPTPTATPSVVPSPTPPPTATPPPSPTPYPPANPLDVVINEIGWMGTAASAHHEYIELYNTTAEAIVLDGWTLRAIDGTPDIALSGTIPAGGYFLLERTSDNTISDIAADQIYTGALQNIGELLELRDGTDQLIDAANHDGVGWFAGTVSPGFYSMERIDPAVEGTEASNWRSNDGCLINGLDADGNPLNATPKSLNSAFYPSRPAQLNLNAGDGEVTLSWLASARGRYELAGYNVYRRQTGQSYQEPLNEEPIVSTYYVDDTVTNGVRYFYVVRSVDVEENESYCASVEETVIPGPPPPLGDNVIISEVMFNPIGDDNLYEWIELYNPTSASIGLDQWWIANADHRGKFTFPAGGGLSIGPGQFLILGATEFANNGDVDVVYNNQPTTEGNIRLRDTGDDVYLYNDLNELVDHVSYSGNWIRTAGHSIVRKAVSRSSNFVELQNIGERPVNLAGLKIFDGSETDTLQAFHTDETMLEPGGFALIVNNLFYYERYEIPPETVVATCGDLAIGSGLTPFKDVILYDRDGSTVVDTFTSFSAVQDPPVNVSVEKIDPFGGDDETNWGYCVDPEGSTPGLINSLSVE